MRSHGPTKPPVSSPAWIDMDKWIPIAFLVLDERGDLLIGRCIRWLLQYEVACAARHYQQVRCTWPPSATQTRSANERVRSYHDADVALVPHGPSTRGEQPF